MTVPVQVTVCPSSAVVGEAAQETLKAEPLMTRLKVTFLLSGEPVTLMKWVPTGAVGPTARVICEVQVGAQEAFRMLSSVTPVGKPETLIVTG